MFFFFLGGGGTNFRGEENLYLSCAWMCPPLGLHLHSGSYTYTLKLLSQLISKTLHLHFLGGRFGYFYFFCSGRGKGRRCPRRWPGVLFQKRKRGRWGYATRRRGRGKGARGGDVCGEGGGGGQKYFSFFGAEIFTKLLIVFELRV